MHLVESLLNPFIFPPRGVTLDVTKQLNFDNKVVLWQNISCLGVFPFYWYLFFESKNITSV